MLTINNLNKNFRDFNVLKDVYMNAEKGQIYGLVGSNGCGKTTLLKHIMNIFVQDTGSIYFNEDLVNETSDAINKFYYVQDDLFFPHQYTLNMLYKYERKLYPNISLEKYNKLTRFFNIDTNKNLNRLSKGQRKQAAFILAMAVQPEVLLLDEIVDGLDAVIKRKFWNVLIKEVVERQVTVIISSHDLKELDNICDKVGIMHEGTIIKEENLEKLKSSVKRVQFAINKEFEEIYSEHFEIIKNSKIGSVYFSTIRGSLEEFRKSLEGKYNVLIFDELPMNLEEIFITELGGAGYGTDENIIS